MNYVKKMCILRQIRQGFSGDGRALTGLIKIEQYGKNLAVEVSIINFAPLTSGEYYCLLADEKGRTEMLPLRGKSLFNVVTDLETEAGFCGVICFVKNGIFPIAYGTNGDHVYDWRALLNDAVGLPKSTEQNLAVTADATKNNETERTGTEKSAPQAAKNTQNEPPMSLTKGHLNEVDEETATETANETAAPYPTENSVLETNESPASNKNYDDELVAANNYYKENEDERHEPEKDREDAQAESGDQTQNPSIGANAEKDENDEDVLAPFEKDPDGYYLSVKSEIDELFSKFPKDETLKQTFPASEWIRIEKNGEYQLVGVIYHDWKARYICYAIPTQTPDTPPEEIAEICTFVPNSAFETDKGYFVIFQSAATGECIKPSDA